MRLKRYPFSAQVQFNSINQGRCGECGDEWSLPRPRANDEGGIYGTGIIGQTYAQASVSAPTTSHAVLNAFDSSCALHPVNSVDSVDCRIDVESFGLLWIPSVPQTIGRWVVHSAVLRSASLDAHRWFDSVLRLIRQRTLFPRCPATCRRVVRLLRPPMALHSR